MYILRELLKDFTSKFVFFVFIRCFFLPFVQHFSRVNIVPPFKPNYSANVDTIIFTLSGLPKPQYVGTASFPFKTASKTIALGFVSNLGVS